MRQRPVVYRLQGMETVAVQRDLAYCGDPDLLMDVYRPQGADRPLPAVVFVHGDAPPEVLAGAKGWGQYTSWGRLTAASGLAAVTFDHRSSRRFLRPGDVTDDVAAAFAFVGSRSDELGIDADRLGLWSCSMGAPYALSRVLDATLRVRCAVALYGPMDLRPLARAAGDRHDAERVASFSPLTVLPEDCSDLPPLLVVRAGRDVPELNATIDGFVTTALARNAPLELWNHPRGRHAFDVLDDLSRSQEIIARTLVFLRRHLLG